MAYVINLDKSKSIRTHWIALNVNGEDVICFDGEHISKEFNKIPRK